MRTIQIVGPGSDRCLATERVVTGFVERCAPGSVVEIVRDPEAATALGVFAIPGVIVDGTLKSVGRVPDEGELIDWLLPAGEQGCRRPGPGGTGDWSAAAVITKRKEQR